MKLLSELYINTMNVIMPDGPIDQGTGYNPDDPNIGLIILFGIMFIILSYYLFKYISNNKNRD